MRYATGCDHCGQIDDHPKLHYGDETYHHDCLPVKVKLDLADDEVVGKIVAACEGGLHGDELREHITQLHQEN